MPTPRSKTGATRPRISALPRVGSYMPDSSRSSVDLPAPLCPTRPTRAPWRSSRSMSRSASMIGTLRALSMFPPTTPSTVFFNERLRPSKTGKSTHAFDSEMLTSVLVEVVVIGRPSHPVRHPRAVAPEHHQGRKPTHQGDDQDHHPVPQLLRLPQQRPPHDLDEVHERVEFHESCALGDRRVGAVQEILVDPDDGRQEERQLDDALDDRGEVAEARGHHPEQQCHP